MGKFRLFGIAVQPTLTISATNGLVNVNWAGSGATLQSTTDLSNINWTNRSYRSCNHQRTEHRHFDERQPNDVFPIGSLRDFEVALIEPLLASGGTIKSASHSIAAQVSFLAMLSLEWQSKLVSTKMIERELAELRKRVMQLEGTLARKSHESWKQIIGVSKNQTLDHEAARLGAQWRSKANKRK